MPDYHIWMSRQGQIRAWDYDNETYEAAREGTAGLQYANLSTVHVFWSNNFNGTYYECYESFYYAELASIPVDEEIISARISAPKYLNWDHGAGQVPAEDDETEIRIHDWGATFNTSAWVPGSQLGSKPLVARRGHWDDWSTGVHNTLLSEGDTLVDYLNTRPQHARFVVSQKYLRLGNEPTTYEEWSTPSSGWYLHVVTRKTTQTPGQPLIAGASGGGTVDAVRTLPAGMAPGDLIVMLVASTSARTDEVICDAPGWTPLNASQIGAGQNAMASAWWKLVTEDDITDPVRPFDYFHDVSGPVYPLSITWLDVYNVNPLSPIGDSSTNAYNAVSPYESLKTTESILQNKAEAMLVVFGVANRNGANKIDAGGFFCAEDNPTDWVELVDDDTGIFAPHVALGAGMRYTKTETGVVSLQYNGTLIDDTALMALFISGFPTVEFIGPSVLIEGGAAETHYRRVTLDTTCSAVVGIDPVPVDDMRFSLNGTDWGYWVPYATSYEIVLDETMTVYAQYRVENDGDQYTSDEASDDITFVGWDVATFVINDGEQTTESQLVHADIDVHRGDEEPEEMGFSFDGGHNWTQWFNYATPQWIVLPVQTVLPMELMTVYLRVRGARPSS